MTDRQIDGTIIEEIDKDAIAFGGNILKRCIMKEREQLKRLRESAEMNRAKISEYLEVPYAVELEGELGDLDISPYRLHLMEYQTRIEKLASEADNETM